ncbi:FxSxx-COOH system tetratricopeptide repeat protein [Actinoallomurus spadix]|uniref:FxSxx-COOH system tetratricopeptide repeat protein n=1 Tax=Actinoallomurus spadix TaxID=79912 RepID=UPI0031D95E5D
MAEEQGIEAQRRLDFYISYAGPDRLWAEWIGWHLKQAGYTVELDVWDWLPGDNIILSRESALRRADRVLALCSAAYFTGRFTGQDWTAVMAAQERESSRLIPIRVEDIDHQQLPEMLSTVQSIDLFDTTEAEARRRLLAGLSGALGPDGTPAFPGPAGPPIPTESDPADTSAPRLPGAARPSNWQVPTRNPAFTGRAGLLVAVRETLLSTPTGVVVLHGQGGMGKTQLSLEYAHRFASDYNTAWVIDAEQPGLIAAQLADLAIKLDAATSAVEAETAAKAAITALRDAKRWLLVFDNVEDPDHLTGYLPEGQGHVLVTTRNPDWAELGALVAVEEFTRAESIALLTGRVAGLNQADANLLAEDLGDLPLALAQAAGVLARTGIPAGEYRRLLADQATEVLDKGSPRSYRVSLAAATLVALDKLTIVDHTAANLLRLCGYLAPEPIPVAWLHHQPTTQHDPGTAAQLGELPTSPFTVGDACAHISHYGLGRIDQQGLRLHRLTQAIVRDHTRSYRTDYHAAIVSILTTADPGDPEAPGTWTAWARLTPHLIASEPATTPHTALRTLATRTLRYLLVSGQANAALTLAGNLHDSWTGLLGPDNTHTLTAAQHLAHARHDCGNYKEASQLLEDTLQRRRRVLGDDHPDTLQSANDLATNMGALGRYKESLALNEDTLQRRRRVLGEDHPDSLQSAQNLAGPLYALGRFRESLALDEDTLQRRRRVLGEDHPGTLHSAQNLAITLYALGQYRESLVLNDDTLGRYRRVLGEDHPDTLRSARSRAATLNALGKHKESLALSEDTLGRYRRVLGEDHPDTLCAARSRAVTLNALGRHKESLALSEDTLGRCRRVLGEDHPETLQSAYNVAVILYALGRRKESLALSEDTLGRCRRVLGEDHPDTLRSARARAVTLYALGWRKESLALSEDTLGRCRRVLGEDHPDTVRSIGAVVQALEGTGRRKAARNLKKLIPRRMSGQ